MITGAKIFQNTDKFYGLADSALISAFRFACGLAIARLGGPEIFATYILYVTTNVIFQLIPSASYLTPLLNRGTGACPAVYGSLCQWAQRGVERTALVFFFSGCLLMAALAPLGVLSAVTALGFLGTASMLLLQNAARTRMQMEFKLSHALLADTTSCLLHVLTTLVLWLNDWSILSAYWWGACIGSLYGWLRMRSVAKPLRPEATRESIEAVKQAKQDSKSILRGSIANSACSRIQPYLLGSIASVETLAHFGVLWTLIGPIRLLTMAISNLLRPRLALYANQARELTFQKTYRLTLLLVVLCSSAACVLSIAYGTHITGLLFGVELQGAGHLLYMALLYAGLDALTSCQMIATQILHANGAQLTARLRIHSAVIALALFVPATLSLGLAGTIGSLIAAELYYAIACRILSGKSVQNEDFTGTAQGSQFMQKSPVKITKRQQIEQA